MVTRNDVISNRWSSQLKGKYLLFQLLSTIKVNLAAKIMQSAYLCIIFHVKHKKLPFLAVLTWFPTLGKIQDVHHCWWLVKKIKGLPLKVKSFQNTAAYQKLLHNPKLPPPPTPLYHGGGMNLRVRSRVSNFIGVRWWLNHWTYLLTYYPLCLAYDYIKNFTFVQLTIDVTGREVLVISNTTLARQTRNAARSTITVVPKQIIAAATDQLVSFFKGSFLLHVLNSFFLIDFVVTLFATLDRGTQRE